LRLRCDFWSLKTSLLGSSAVARRASPRAVASVASIFRDLESFQNRGHDGAEAYR
jgi:hypothetical protein